MRVACRLALAAGLAVSGAAKAAPHPAGGPGQPATCAVLEAAYTAAIHSATPIHPSRLVVAWHAPSPLRTWVAEYRANLPLTKAEFDELAARYPAPTGPGPTPTCAWRSPAVDYGEATPVSPPRSSGYATSFSDPVWSRDGRIAIVEVSFYQGRFGFGQTCVARRAGQGWSARCRNGWIT